MFIRTKKQKGRVYRSVVENYRENGKVRQRVIAYLPIPEESSFQIPVEGKPGKTRMIHASQIEDISDALEWYATEFQEAKFNYRSRLSGSWYVSEGFTRSEFEEFDLMRAKCFKLYRLVTILRAAVDAPSTHGSRGEPRSRIEAKRGVTRAKNKEFNSTVSAIVRHRRRSAQRPA